jgi:hypothetical protein
VAGASSTTTTLAVGPTPAVAGSPATLTATVSSTGSTPTGAVTFADSGVPIGTSTLNNAGQAILSVPAGDVTRTRVLTATFNGSLGALPSTSALTPLAVVIAPIPLAKVVAVAGVPVAASPAATAADVTAQASGASGLAATGPVDTIALTSVATAMILGGGGLLVLSARRRRPFARHRLAD